MVERFDLTDEPPGGAGTAREADAARAEELRARSASGADRLTSAEVNELRRLERKLGMVPSKPIKPATAAKPAAPARPTFAAPRPAVPSKPSKPKPAPVRDETPPEAPLAFEPARGVVAPPPAATPVPAATREPARPGFWGRLFAPRPAAPVGPPPAPPPDPDRAPAWMSGPFGARPTPPVGADLTGKFGAKMSPPPGGPLCGVPGGATPVFIVGQNKPLEVAGEGGGRGGSGGGGGGHGGGGGSGLSGWQVGLTALAGGLGPGRAIMAGLAASASASGRGAGVRKFAGKLARGFGRTVTAPLRAVGRTRVGRAVKAAAGSRVGRAVGQAGGAVAGGAVAAAGPLLAAAVGIKAAADHFTARGRELAGYSGALAGARATADTRSKLADIREANSGAGNEMAKLIENQSRMEDAMREMLLPLKELFLKVVNFLYETAAGAIDQFLAGLEYILDIGNEVYDFCNGPLGDRSERIDGAIEDIKKVRVALAGTGKPAGDFLKVWAAEVPAAAMGLPPPPGAP